MTRTILTSVLVGIVCFAAGYFYRGQQLLPPPHVKTASESPNVESELHSSNPLPQKAKPKAPVEVQEELAFSSDVSLQGFLESNPYREDLRRGIKFQLDERYGPLFTKLMYTDEQSTKFIRLVTELAIEWVDRQNALSGAQAGFELEMEKRLSRMIRQQKLRSEMETRWDHEIRELLQDDYPQFAEYEKTVQQRGDLQRLTSQLADPLDDYTREQLVSVLVEEGMFANVPERQYFLFGDAEIQYRKDMQEALTHRDQGFLERASAFLSKEQLEKVSQMVARYRESREQQIERLENPIPGRRF